MTADESAYAIGQAVFLRTDSLDYAEDVIPFRSLDEMVRICSQRYPNQILDKLVVYSMAEGEPCALTLGFVASTKGHRAAYPQLSTQ